MPGTRAVRTAVPDVLRVPNYRRYLSSQLLATSATWMQRIAQDWLVLELTGSASAVGVAVALQFMPMLVFGPVAGPLIDRHDKRALVMAAQAASAALAAVLAVLCWADVVEVWHVFAVAAGLGVVTSVAQPAQQVLVAEVVGDGQLRNAVSINNAVAQGSGMLGPAAAGALIHAVGHGWSFAATALLALLAATLLLTLRRSQLSPLPRVPRARGQVREGFSYIAGNATLRWVVVLAGLLGAFGMNAPVVLTAFAENIWHSGVGGFGAYNSLAALGALVGALLSTRIRTLTARTVVIAAAAFGAVESVAALMPAEPAFMLMLVVVGAATLSFLTLAATFVQLTAAPMVRGRVMAIYTPVLLGGHAFGGLLAGWLTDGLGVRAGLVIVGAAAIASAVAISGALGRVTRSTPVDAVEPSALQRR